MTTAVLVTCATWPHLSESDRRYAAALAARGITVTDAPWNGPFAPFARADLVVLRSNWDYHHQLDAFTAWLDRVARADAQLFNAPDLVRWNLDKRYLLDLARRGTSTPATHIVPPTVEAIARVLDEEGWDRAVLKPSIGASGHNVQLIERDGDMVAMLTGTGLAATGREVMVQECMPEIRDGELALVFFDGEFSHVFRRTPAAGEFRVNSQYQGTAGPTDAADTVIAQARAVLDLLPAMPLYARVDGLVRDGRFILMGAGAERAGTAAPARRGRGRPIRRGNGAPPAMTPPLLGGPWPSPSRWTGDCRQRLGHRRAAGPLWTWRVCATMEVDKMQSLGAGKEVRDEAQPEAQPAEPSGPRAAACSAAGRAAVPH